MTLRDERQQRRADIAGYCKRLMLTQAAVTLCETLATPTQEVFVQQVLAAELAQRETNRQQRLIARAGFPSYKTLAGYDRTGAKLPTNLTWEDLETGTYLADHRNLVLFGAVGVGKSHMAVALGMNACEHGHTVKFYTVTQLVVRLAEAKRAGTLERLFKEIGRTDLLILDEWGFVPVDQTGAQLLFRVIADSYETRSIIITTNLEFSKWGGVFTDDQMAAAMIDRLAHHGHLIVFDGESYRMKHALMVAP